MKERFATGDQILTVGHVYFDKNIREVVYDISFPHHHTFAVTDFGILNDSAGVRMNENFSTHLVDFSVFNLALSGKLDYFGLDNSVYQMVNVTNEDSMVISEWKLPEELGSIYGKMLVSQKNNRLYGLVSFDKDGEMLSQQFFTDYVQVNDIEFPSRLIQISYKEGSMIAKKVITFRNIKLNEPLNENYRFSN